MVDTNLDKCKKLDNSEENIFAWLMREAVARKISLTIWGDGYLFQTENDKINKIFKKIEFINQLENTLAFVERNCSMYGRAIVTINKTKTNEFMLNVAQPFYFSGVGKAFIQPQLAVIWQRFVIDTKHYLVESIYDTQKVVSNVYTEENHEKIRVLNGESEILKQFQIEKEWKHNLGFVPVMEFVNIPNFQQNMFNDAYTKLTDWFPAVAYEKTAFITKKNLEKELAYCHSRVIVENPPQNLVDKIKYMNSKNGIVDNDMILNTDSASEIKFTPGNGDYTKYTNTLDHIYDFYFKLCGQSRFSEGGGAQKTVAETASIRTGMIEQTNQKIRLRETQTKDLLRKLFCCYGVVKNYWEFKDDEAFDFRINGNITKDENTWIDSQLKLIQMGVKTEIDLIQDIFNISKDEAEEKFLANKEWLEENSLSMSDFVEYEENDNDNAIDKTTGEHKNDAVKRGEA